MKKFKVIFFTLFLLFAFSSCTNLSSNSYPSSSTQIQTVHTVKVDNEVQKVLHGELAVRPTINEKRGGLVLVDYFLGDEIYDWSKPVMEDLEIKSKWGRDESPFDVKLSVIDATSTWTAKYSFDGIIFNIDVEDPNICNSSNDIGMNDNIEIVLQAKNTIKYDKRYTIDFLCDANGNHWIRRAKSVSEFGEDRSIEVNAIKGKTYDYKFSLTNNGYQIEVFFSYEILNTTYQEAFGKIKFIPAMRNTRSQFDTTFAYYTEHSTMWNRPLSFITIDEDNNFVKRMYTPVNVSEHFEKSSLYNGKKLLDNMAKVGGEKISETRAFVSGTALFDDRTYSLRLYGYDDNLSGLTYLYDTINGSYGEVVEEGYVIIIAPAFGYAQLNFDLTKDGFVKIISDECGLAESVAGGALDETMNYYVKWCNQGEVISYSKYYVALFRKDANVSDHCWNTQKTTFHEDFKGHETIDRNWQGVTTMERSKGGRLFAGWVTGGNGEPQRDNYIVIVYSDDNGKTWKDLWWANGDYYNYTLNDPQFWVDPDGVLWIFYCQHMYGKFDGQSPTWAIKILNPDAENLEHTEPVKIVDGLMRNQPIVLSDGTWILQGTNHCNSEYTSIYHSFDKGETWSVRSYVYLPVGINWDETILIEKLDGSLWMTIRNTTGYIYQTFSYDKGYTWEDATNTGIANPCSRFQIFRLPSGNLMMINNNHSSHRINMTAYISKDDGLTWSDSMLIDINNTTYPDYSIDYETGEVWIVYDLNRVTVGDIMLVHFDEEYIKTHTSLEQDRFSYVSKLSPHNPTYVDGEYLGNTINNYATAGFDLVNDNGTSPSVIQYGAGTQNIFFKNFKDSKYYASTYLKARSIINRDTYPKFGFMIKNDAATALIYLDGGDLLRNNYVGVAAGYDISSLDWDNALSLRADMNYHYDFTKLEVVKDSEGLFSIYVNSVLVFKDISINGFGKNTEDVVGFFTFNTRCEFNDYGITVDETAINERKNENYSCDTLFIGDSFFDPRVIMRDFYNFFEGAKNTAVYGETINYWIDNFDKLVVPYNPKTLVVHIGTNDVDRGDSADVAFNELKQLFDLINSKLPNTKVLLFSLEPTMNYSHLFEEIDAANRKIKQHISWLNNYTYLDFADTYLFVDNKTRVDTTMFEDGIHLTGRGIKIVVEFINTYLNALKGE